jgi:hypothetical protein
LAVVAEFIAIRQLLRKHFHINRRVRGLSAGLACRRGAHGAPKNDNPHGQRDQPHVTLSSKQNCLHPIDPEGTTLFIAFIINHK